jgi:alpha,alpha-trehalase
MMGYRIDREKWRFVENRPIADYALLCDCHSAALVSSSGSIDWLCYPDFDSQSVFGRLLDETAGHWSISACGATSVSRRYLEETMALQTTFQTDTGTAVLNDAMVLGEGTRGHDLGQSSPHALLRSVACTSGQVTIDFEYAPRPEYGLVLPLLKVVSGGILCRGGSSVLFLSTPIEMELSENSARATFQIKSGQEVCFLLQYASVLQPPLSGCGQKDIANLYSDTVEAWRSWSRLHQNYNGPWRDRVAHSGRVLQALTYFPT